MSKELEALFRIKREAGIPYFSSLYDIDMWKEDFKIIEKSLETLKRIRKLPYEMHNNVIWLICESTEEAEKIKGVLL